VFWGKIPPQVRRQRTERKQNESEWLAPYQITLVYDPISERVPHLVGEMINAPISFFLNSRSLLISFSNIGIANASVFPEPVTAYAHLSNKPGVFEIPHLNHNILMFPEKRNCAGLNGCHLREA
jgi:hypothetical protein